MDSARNGDTVNTGRGARALSWLARSPFAGVLVLCVSLAFTVTLWRTERDDIEHHRQLRFEKVAERITAQLQDRMLDYEDLLQGASGLFAAVPDVDTLAWREYFASIGLDTRLRGTQLVGYAPLDQADGTVRLALVYPDTGENLRARDYHPSNDQSQRAALARARDTGFAALSERATLPVESQIRVQPGFMLYLPVYRPGMPAQTPQERQSAITGYLLCALRIHDLLQELRLELESDAVIDLYDGTPAPGSLLFTSRGQEMPALSEDRQITVGGHQWTLRVGSSPSFDAHAGSSRPLLMLLGGSALSGTLAALVLLGARHQRKFLSAHQDLARSHARYLSLVDSVPGTAFRVGPALPWRLEYISEGVSELTGKPPGHWLSSGDFLQELIHPDDLTRVLRVVAWSTATGTPFEVEYRLRAEGAATRWVRQRTRALRGDAGELLGMSGVLTDMTHTRELMDTLSRQRETLEEQVHARTAELLLAKDAAESASVAKSRFLSTMSHELRTPMNAVIGFSTLLAENEQDPTRKRQLQRIQGAGKDLLELVNRVLDFARADAGTLALESARFEVKPILQAASERLRLGVAGRSVSWHVGTVADVPAELVGDGRRIREVLLELVENALEYTPSGSITVELRAEHHSTGVELAFAVRDTGCGVDNSNAERLFSAFEQADASYTRKHEGIGLGLALARQFVTLMGGSIGVEANPGGGSIFWFRVRVHASEQPTPHLHWSAPEPLAQGPDKGCASDTRALGPEERERLRAACAEISALLREGDLDARDLLQAHAPLLQAALPAHAPRIVEAVESFDFDTALATLEGGCREAGLDFS